MPDTSIRLTKIEFRPPQSATPQPLVTRANRLTPPSTAWTPGTDGHGVAFVLSEWKNATRLDIEVTLEVQSEQDTALTIAAASDRLASPILGRVPVTGVTIPASQAPREVAVPVALEGVQLAEAAVGAHDAVLRWSFDASAAGTSPVVVNTKHRVYLCLEPPVAPWTQLPAAGKDIPWIEALDWACRAAAGATNAETVRAMVTRRVDALGGMSVNAFGSPTRFTYSTVPHFLSLPTSLNRFALADFLAVASGTANAAARANCSDLAAAVVVFTNILGCPSAVLNLQRSATQNFKLNTVQVFGFDEAESATFTQSGFAFHRVATAEGAGKPIYDACVRLDFLDEPGTAPFSWLVAAGTVLTDQQDLGYVERLIEPEMQPLVTHTAVSTPTLTTGPLPQPVDSFMAQRCNCLREELEADLESISGPSAESLLGRDNVVLLDDSPWLWDDQPAVSAHRYLVRDAANPTRMVLLREVVCATAALGRDAAAAILASGSVPFTVDSRSDTGLHLVSPSGTEAVLVSGKRVVVASSIGATQVDVLRFLNERIDLR